jgi:hypothetical protein
MSVLDNLSLYFGKLGSNSTFNRFGDDFDVKYVGNSHDIDWADVLSLTNTTPCRTGKYDSFIYKAGESALERWVLRVKKRVVVLDYYGANFILSKGTGNGRTVLMFGRANEVIEKRDYDEIVIKNVLSHYWNRPLDTTWGSNAEYRDGFAKGAMGYQFPNSDFDGGNESLDMHPSPQTIGGYLQLQSMINGRGYYGVDLPNISHSNTLTTDAGRRVEVDYLSVKEIESAKVCNSIWLRGIGDTRMAVFDPQSVLEYGEKKLDIGGVRVESLSEVAKMFTRRAARRIEVRSPIDFSFHFYGKNQGNLVTRNFQRQIVSDLDAGTLGMQLKMVKITNGSEVVDNAGERLPVCYLVDWQGGDGVLHFRNAVSGVFARDERGLWKKHVGYDVQFQSNTRIDRVMTVPQVQAAEWFAFFEGVLVNGGVAGLPLVVQDLANPPLDFYKAEWYLQSTRYDVFHDVMTTVWVDGANMTSSQFSERQL